MATSTPAAVPKRLMGYQITRILGKGSGSGSVVYEALDENDRRFALKHLVRSSPKIDLYIEQADVELQYGQRFDHPGIRKVIQVMKSKSLARGLGDMVNSRALFVTAEVGLLMEYVEGEILGAHSTHNLSRVCDLFAQAAKAIDHIHKAGFVHTDLKPSNILVTPEEKVKVIDLGMVCANNTVRRAHGSPGFGAPEQALERPLTSKCDIYSFGATMYRLLTGRNIPTVLDVKTSPGSAVMERPEMNLSFPAPREIDPGVPPALSTLIMECVNRKPDQRPASIMEVHDRIVVAISQIQRAAHPYK